MNKAWQNLEHADSNTVFQEPFDAVEQREKLVQGGHLHWVHYLVVGLSLLLTLGAWHYSKQQVLQKVQQQFDREAEQTIELIKERMALYENALWGGVSLIDSNQGEVSYQQWSAYAKSLHIEKTYPGINGIGVISYATPRQLPALLQTIRQSRPGYQIFPEHNKNEFWPIVYIEPEQLNHKAVGLDMAFERNRYAAVIKARDTGTAQLTGPITLVQDAKQTPGFLFYTPFYQQGKKPETVEARRQYIKGATYAPFIMRKLMQGTLAAHKRHVAVHISDNSHELYHDKQTDPKPMFKKQVTVPMYGRQWRFDIRSNLSFRQAVDSQQPNFILAGGLIIDGLLLGLFILLSRANRTALSYADKMTSDLEIKTRNLEKSNRDLEEFSYVASHDLKSPLNAIKQLVGWLEEDCSEFIPDSSRGHLKLLKQRSERMMTLLNDLLAYARIGSLVYEREEINLRELSADIFTFLDAPGEFSCTAPDVKLKIARTPFDFVMRNLISNAIKHHDKGRGKITITYRQKMGFHQIRVQDDGPGIPPALHKKAMEMFQTLKPRDQVEGSGMGLAMVNKFAEHQGGSIIIDSDGGRGTGIILLWPIENTTT
ncbi:CHASE domain-containing protein [Thalassomonas viridans]|uniref:histidine kinase n=1 Tax=Thalassomonas viridans TaxID=137584 RepID=A0AAF0CC09_9GAMM|nr:CHASE domain-containing protein [Thalassomonas viridans]WDE07560.1 CHASE domain-containing protein [Thalassomonas viridans]